jgi:hypothetical protein
MVFGRREASDCAEEDKQNFSTHSNRGFAVSREEKNQKNLLFIGKSAIPELNFVHANLGFFHEMWPSEAAQKSRKIRFLRPSGRELCAKDSEKLKKKWAFQTRFECNSPVRHGYIFPAARYGRIALERPQISHFLTSTETLTWTSTERSKNRLGH